MNTFGRLFRVSILGESHGSVVGVLLDGCPAGLPLEVADFEADLARRRPGAKGTTARREPDIPRLLSGVFQGRTTGAPLLIQFNNQDVRPEDYDAFAFTPRPGHADLVARQKYGGCNDPRGSGHFSGRLTAGLVAAGVVAKKLLPRISIRAEVLEVGGAREYAEGLERAIQAKDSLGGLVECRVQGLPPGLGEPFFDGAESLLAHLAFAIPAVKGVEFGSGFALARMKGSEANDEIVDRQGTTRTNHAGGLHGGITSGNELVLRIAVKPTSTLGRIQQTVDLRTGETTELAAPGRHDACIALRMPPVLEAAVAIGLADLMAQEGRIPRIWP